MKKFSDFSTEESHPTGDKIKIEEILGKEIEVTGYRISESQYKKTSSNNVLTLQFVINGENRILFTGSGVLAEQIVKYKDEIPFMAKIEKVDKFYTFT